MKTCLAAVGWAFALVCLARGQNAEIPIDRDNAVAPVTTSAAASAPANDQRSEGGSSPTAFEHDGQSFVLANSSTGKNCETDEYALAGEKLGEWTQLLTVQRLTLAKAAGTDEFLAYFQRRVTADGASLEILNQAKAASVFAVRFPRSERNDEQVMVCLAFVDRAKPAVLNVVQYAIKPHRIAMPVVEMRLRSWRDKFVAQALALNAPGTKPQ